MKNIIFFFFIVLLVIFQVSFLPYLKIYNAVPNLLLVAIVSWCIIKNYKAGYYWAIIGGFLIDLFSQTSLGASIFGMLSVVLFVFFIVNNFINTQNIYSKMAITFFATIFYKLIVIIFLLVVKLLRLSDYGPLISKEIIISTGIEAVLNAILILLFFKAINTLHQFILRYEARRQA